MINTYQLEVGDKIRVEEPGREPVVMTVWQISAPGTYGTAVSAGPHISARISPGGYGITFDSKSFLCHHISLEDDTKETK